MKFDPFVLLKKSLDLLVPPLCLKCQDPIMVHGTFCCECWNQLTFLRAPRCDQCATPFFEEGICLKCYQTPPYYDHARCLLVYNTDIKPLILALKYSGAEHIGILLGQLMGHFISAESNHYDLILPVPLHWKRFFKRGYNQAALLAQGVSKVCRIPWKSHILYRTITETMTQAGATAQQRQKNVARAFAVRPQTLQGKKIILVDDVMATGATLNACSQRLKQQGAEKILVLTIAKTLKG